MMHRLLEGVCMYDLRFILKEMVLNLKYFTIETLNNKLSHLIMAQQILEISQLYYLNKYIFL